jgi:UDP-glucose-4-epimerase GalE/galactokinase
MQSEGESLLICGGSGFIGGSFAYSLARAHPALKIVIIDNLSTGRHVNSEISQFYECDIGDSEQVASIITEHTIKSVFHFSAFLAVGESVSNPLKYYENNVSKSIELLKTCVANGVENFVFSSSAAVYGQPKYTPIDENHSTDPINPYGRTKLIFESILADVTRAHPNFNYVSLRYFNVAGSISKKVMHGESCLPETHLIPLVLDVALGIKPYISIFGTDYDTPDGSCIRDYIDIKDLCDAHMKAWDYLKQTKKSQVINLGTAKGTSVKEIIDIARRITQHDIPLKEGPRREGDPSQLIASNAKALELLNWSPKRSIEKTIERAWAWQLVRYGVISHHRGFNLSSMVTRLKGIFENKDFFKVDEQPIQSQQSNGDDEKPKLNENSFRLFFAPGRINLIGEHVDYNGGLVLPCAINRGTYALCRLNDSNKLNFYSDNYSQLVTYDLSKNFAEYPKKGHWSDYIIGCLIKLGNFFKPAQGFDVFISGNMPMAAGMSSSASLTVAVITAIIAMSKPESNSIDASKETIPLIAKWVENEFVGVSCGIMDQFIVANAKAKQAMLLNCDTLEFQNISVNMAGYCFLLCNTNLQRELRTSKYNERFKECRLALEKLQKFKNYKHLAHFDQEDLETLLTYLEKDKILVARTKHVLSENRRVKRAFECLKLSKIQEFGELLTESGMSLQNEYEVTGQHLDWMVQAALICEGVLGARMMGAGFGGCALVLASRTHLKNIKDVIGRIYASNAGIDPTFYEFEIDEGVREILF